MEIALFLQILQVYCFCILPMGAVIARGEEAKVVFGVRSSHAAGCELAALLSVLAFLKQLLCNCTL